MNSSTLVESHQSTVDDRTNSKFDLESSPSNKQTPQSARSLHTHAPSPCRPPATSPNTAMNPRRGLLLLAGGCAISVARADPLAARVADHEKAESSSSGGVAPRRQLLQSSSPTLQSSSPTLHHDRHDPGIPWDLQPIVISHPDHDHHDEHGIHDSDIHDSDLVISERTQQDLFVASFILVLIELILEILVAGFNIHEDLSKLPLALVKKVRLCPSLFAPTKHSCAFNQHTPPSAPHQGILAASMLHLGIHGGRFFSSPIEVRERRMDAECRCSRARRASWR